MFKGINLSLLFVVVSRSFSFVCIHHHHRALNVFQIPQSKEKLMNIKVDILKEAGGRVFEEHQRFLQTFDQKWRNDENIMLILSAIALFTPDRPRVVHFDVIKLEQVVDDGY